MEEYINELIDIGLGSIIDVSVDKQISKDQKYQDNIEKAGELLEKLRANISLEEYEIFEQYMDCIMNVNERACTILYLVGAKNTIKFLKN